MPLKMWLTLNTYNIFLSSCLSYHFIHLTSNEYEWLWVWMDINVQASFSSNEEWEAEAPWG